MRDDDFERDDEKAARNLRLRGIAFDVARHVLRDPNLIDELDERQDYGEERYGAIGMQEGRLFFVAYTIRNGRIRIISVRKAEPYERRKYHEKEI